MPTKYAAKTKSSIPKTQQDIGFLLRKSAEEWTVTERPGKGGDVIFKMRSKVVRMRIAYEKIGGFTQRQWDQDCCAKWRGLLLVIKAKLVAIETGIAIFDQEFLPYFVTKSGLTIFEALSPNLTGALNEDFSAMKSLPAPESILEAEVIQ